MRCVLTAVAAVVAVAAVLLSPPRTAAGPPVEVGYPTPAPPAPMSEKATLESDGEFRRNIRLRVLPSGETDVLFNTDSKDWRWRLTSGHVHAIGSPSKGGSADGRYAVSFDTEVEVYDFDTNSSILIASVNGSAATHDNRVAWVDGSSIKVADISSDTSTDFNAPNASKLSLFEEHVAYVVHGNGTSRVVVRDIPSRFLHHIQGDQSDDPHLLAGKVAFSNINMVTVETLGIPSSRFNVALPPGCWSASLPKIGGTQGELIVFVGWNCVTNRNPYPAPPETNLFVYSSASKLTFLISSIEGGGQFDIKGNRLAFADSSGDLHIVDLLEEQMYAQ